jgi:CRP-like cAMP-binding protein
VLSELNGLLAEYLDQDTVSIAYQVVVVPQSAEQETAIRTLLPAASRIETGFGYAYLCGTYHSQDYAELIRNRYRSLRLFALVVHGDGNDLQAEELVEDIQFSPEELEMYAAFINRLTPPEFIRLVRTGRWERANIDDILIAEGEAVDRILFIKEGQAEVASKGSRLQGIASGSFVGEMEFLAGGQAFATVTAVSPMLYIAWQRDDLENLLAVNPEMASAMQALFSTDVVKKLHSSSQHMTQHHTQAGHSSPDSR